MTSQRLLLPSSNLTPASRLLTLVGIAIIVAGLYFGRQVLMPLALAGGLAFLLVPVVSVLERCRLGRVPSVLATIVVALALVMMLGWGVTSQFMEIMSHLSDYRTNIHTKIAAIRVPASGKWGKATTTVNDLGKELSAAAQMAETSGGGKAGSAKPVPVQVAAPPRSAAELVRDIVGPLTGLLETGGITIIFTLFILIKREDLRNRFFRLAGSGQLNAMTQALDEASRRLGRYLFWQFVVNAGYGVLFGLGVYALRIPHPLLWGVVGFLFRFLPYIGTPIGALFPMAMAMAVFPGWSQVVLTFVLFLILEIIIGNLVEPWLYGAHTGVSPLAILVASIFWGMLWGPIGLILSTPLTVCLILVGRYVPQLGFLEVLLGDEPVLSTEVHFYQRLLALDENEARKIADVYLVDNSLQDFYDSVLIPVLILAEQDRHRDALDQTRTRFIHTSARELVEDLFVDAADYRRLSGSTLDQPVFTNRTAASPPPQKAVCVPAREEADEIAASMAKQVLQLTGADSETIALDSLANMKLAVVERKPTLICVSALPPFAVTPSRRACVELKQAYPTARLVLGLWGFPGGIERAREKVGQNYVDEVVTSLAELAALITGAKTEEVESQHEVENERVLADKA
jgi:predicted PurR-regulated permease PerM